MNINLLEKLYLTFSPSKKEQAMTKLIVEELNTMKIRYNIDKWGQIYSINQGKPIMVAHQDQVQSKPCEKVIMVKNKIMGFSHEGKLRGLGADDKNGIFIVLEMIRRHREDISFIFSTNEEAGGYLYHLTKELKLNTSTTPYGLIFDRKGSKDIIGTSNQYCCEDLEVAIESIGEQYGYEPTSGVFSDCDELSEWIPCVNLSCGYYKAHTVEEYTKMPDLWKAIKFADELLRYLPTKGGSFATPEKMSYLDKIDWKNYNDSYDYNNYATKTLDELDAENYYVWIDESEGVYFVDDDLGEETFLGENIEDCLGRWPLESGELEICMDIEGTTTASFNNAPIEVTRMQ